MGKGLCCKCYLAQYVKDPKNKRRIDESKTKYYINKVTTETSKKAREAAHFNGNREKALMLSNYLCSHCGTKEKLVVHHIDRSGRGNKKHNNDLSNLMVLCKSCHINIHRKDLQDSKRKR